MKNTTANKVQPSVTINAPYYALAVSRWGNWRVWLNLVLLFFSLGIAIFSIERAHWISPQPQLTLTLFFSIIVVWLLTVVRMPGWALHLLSLGIGALVILWQGTMILPGGSGAVRLFTFIGAWVQGGAGLQADEAKAVFGVLLALLTWLAGYLSAWSVLRRRNAWTAVLLGLLILIVNLSNLPGNTAVYFTLFLLASVLLIIQTNINRQQNLPGQKTSYSGKSLFYLIVSLFVIMVIASSLAWVTPQIRLPALQNAIATSLPWKSGVQDSGFNILKAVPSKKSVSNTSELQDLKFGESWNAGDEIRYKIISPQPAYWQVNVYDRYNSQNWESTYHDEQLREKETDWEETETALGRTQVKYEVIPEINTDVILLTGDFVSAEMPVLVRLGVEGEITGARSPRVLTPGEGYTVRAYIADNSAAGLSKAGESYPEDIKTVYLQLPSGLPDDIRIFTENLTLSAKTPYEKTVLIDTYLAGIPYAQNVKALPEGTDAVADFLFTQKKGFCLHFASAMTVMLRSVGVPARVAVGYLPGDAGEDKDNYLLRDKHYHAWTQVYFPNHGWIDFEPTPSGNTGSQVLLDAPLVSTTEIRQLPTWDLWYYPPGLLDDTSIGDTGSSAQTPNYFSFKVGFSEELGIILLVIVGILAAAGLAYILLRMIRPLYARQVWDVDRERLATSAYMNLVYLAAMNGITPVSQQTPLEFSARIAEIIPEQAQNLDALVKAYLDKRFGPEKGKPGLYEEAEILKTRILVYNAILEKRGRIHKVLWQQ